MTLSSYTAELLKKKTLLQMIQSAKIAGKPTATKVEAEKLLKSVPGLIATNDHRMAVASTLVLILHDGEHWLAKMRREGMFRASRYGYNGKCLRKVVGAALELSTELSLSPQRLEYLKSVLVLLDLAVPGQQLHKAIILRLRTRDRSLKTLMAIVNSAFAIDWPGDREADPNSVQYWSGTELASAFSRLYMIFRDEFGINAMTWNFTGELKSNLSESIYSSLLVDAAKLNELIDAEVMLDGLPYKAETTDSGVLVSSIDSDFEKAVRLGYIQTEQQMAIRLHTTMEEIAGRRHLPSFSETIKTLLDAGLLNYVSLKTFPISRLVFEFPFIPFLLDVLKTDALFLEEFPLLHGVHIDNFHPENNGFLRVSQTLTTLDLLKVQRFFNLIDIAFREKLKTITDETQRRVLMLQSTVMVIKSADLQGMLEQVLSPEQAREMISLLSLTATSSEMGSDAHIDLQYKPFVHAMPSANGYIAIPPSVVGKSNLARSVQYASSIKRATSGTDDPMQHAVVAALREAGFLVQDSFEFNIDGKRETDIFCYRDGFLFVIECKNAYHPCSPHELRNSFDLIKKSEEQLDIRAKWLSNLSNQVRLFEAMGWAVQPTACIRTCAVTANRLFTGYRIGVHPVRQAHELINVLTDGSVGRGPKEPSLRFWRAEVFDIADLIDYLDGKSMIQQQHAGMIPVTRRIDILGRKLDFAQFAMDMEEVARSMTEAYEAIPSSDTEDEDAARKTESSLVPE